MAAATGTIGFVSPLTAVLFSAILGSLHNVTGRFNSILADRPRGRLIPAPTLCSNNRKGMVA